MYQNVQIIAVHVDVSIDLNVSRLVPVMLYARRHHDNMHIYKDAVRHLLNDAMHMACNMILGAVVVVESSAWLLITWHLFDY